MGQVATGTVWRAAKFLCGDFMRPLTEDETHVVFEKLSKFLGTNIKMLVERKDKKVYCFRCEPQKILRAQLCALGAEKMSLLQ